jgi:hypothetical protein
MTTTTEMSPHQCPSCGRVNDLHTGKQDTVPKPNDVSICWGCGALVVFEDAEGRQRLPTDEERARFESDPEVQRVRQHVLTSVTPRQAAKRSWGAQ